MDRRIGREEARRGDGMTVATARWRSTSASTPGGGGSLGVLCLSLLIIVMDNTILNVAIPSLISDLDASNSEIQWIIDAYTLVFAGLLLTTGSLSDRFGRKGALQLGIVAVRHRLGVGGPVDDAPSSSSPAGRSWASAGR